MLNKSDHFSWEKVPLCLFPLSCKILRVLLDEGYPKSQESLKSLTGSTISGVCKALKELESLGLVVEIKQDVKAYIINPYRKEEVKKFITGYDLGKNKPIVVTGHASVYYADVKELPEKFLKYLEQK